MTSQSKDRASVPIPPPLIFFAVLGAGFVLEYLFPLGLPRGFRMIGIVIGAALITIAGLLSISALGSMRKRKTPFDPSRPTTNIVREGAFRFSRNPLYLALVLLQGGAAFLFLSIWLFMGLPILFILLQLLAIGPEETYLTRKFGREYLDYKASVRRWI